MSVDKINDLKRQIRAELEKENSDNDVVLSLSNEIARRDGHQTRFSVDAGIIDRLGRELVGRHETAVSELVKNAYDADATHVELIFENSLQAGGTLYVEDDGQGMTKEQLIDGFMRLASGDKIHNPISPIFKRERAGKKGIGRFAAQRLGSKLTVITQTIESKKAIQLKIDWSSFAADKDLTDIKCDFEFVDKTKPEGTDLIIENLREAWSDATIKRVYKYTADLLQPFPLSKERKNQQKRLSDPGFKTVYFRRDGEKKEIIIDDDSGFFEYALAEIEGYVLDDGQGCWALKSEKLNFPQEVFFIGKDKDDLNAKFQFIKGIHFKCYYFIYESSLLPTQTIKFIRDVANERGGIRLYKNGFRVLPYGEKGNDWIGLDESVRKRSVLGPHQNNSFFGFVEISEESSDLFTETSSREGLIENEAFHELTDFVYRSIVGAALKVTELRGRKSKAGQKNWEKKIKPSTEKIEEAVEKMKLTFYDQSSGSSSGKYEQGSDSDSGKSDYSKEEQFERAYIDFKEGIKEEKAEKEELIEELNMMRILAGLGLVIGQFVHEIKNYFPGFDAEINYLKKLLKEHQEGLKRVDNLEKNFNSLTVYSSYFDEVISRNVCRELEPIELRDVVRTFTNVVKNNLIRADIKMEKSVFIGFDLFTIPMHPSEWASILFNFFTNSKKAIKRKGVEGKIFIKCGRENGKVFLDFSDNGDGIPKENEELIFNAFYTTSSPASRNASDDEALMGSGLGLKIVKDIVEAYNGDVYVTTPEEGFTTTIRVEIDEDKRE
jgi:signal transduction histidine kinase